MLQSNGLVTKVRVINEFKIFPKNKIRLSKIDLECEMDLLRTQKTRQLTALFRQLQAPMEKHNRIEFITRLSDVLKREAPSTVLDAVSPNFLYDKYSDRIEELFQFS